MREACTGTRVTVTLNITDKGCKVIMGASHEWDEGGAVRLREEAWMAAEDFMKAGAEDMTAALNRARGGGSKGNKKKGGGDCQ